jgi:hypothetical protein
LKWRAQKRLRRESYTCTDDRIKSRVYKFSISKGVNLSAGLNLNTRE